ncbi:Aspartic peptidase domain [Pseudocohnilembus persalinus]|uniref:Aspartic peptidase domain n=1 Tax=Pseudocohnilembus persalinus TaxID=266149 RepID=A0A0V0QSS7_PSEPJ|nr:Aspartic peptidase domain [Pseudocohnilembus persalinus]|eukprot:KRX05249.1 Aspartic peptidase domain [Pseudocohnilembus persalinus]
MKYLLLGFIIVASFFQVFSYKNLREEEFRDLDQFEKDILYLEQKLKGDENLKIRLINEKKLEKLIDNEIEEKSHLSLNPEFQDKNQEEIEEIEREYEEGEIPRLQSGKNGKSPLNLEKLKSAYKDYCLKDMESGKIPKDVKDMNLKEKLEAFNRGPCSPVIMMPGILGTSLQVQIDCEKLQKSNPEIFKACGWNTCNSYIPLVRNPPKSEYRLWIGGLTSPMSIFSLGTSNNEHSKCFGNLMSMTFHKDAKNSQEKYSSVEGVSVTIQGDTPGTRDQSQCGDTSIGRLFYSESIDWLDCAFNGYDNMQQLFLAMGYVPGITYQSVPYDFRKAVGDVNSSKKLKKSLINLNKFTGKKTHIITHSYGSLHTLYTLNQFTQDFKDKYINTWIPTGGPLSGAPKVINGFLNTDQDFIQQFGSIFGKALIVGIQFSSQRMINEGSLSMFDLFPKDVQFRHKDQEWMKEILKRVEYERVITSDRQGGVWDQDVPLDFLPEPSEICRPGQGENQYCKTYIYNQIEEHLAQIEDKKFYLKTEEMIEMLKQYSTDKEVIDKFNDSYYVDAFLNLVNPGVKVTNVYGAFEKVNTQFEFQEDPKIYTNREEYYFPNITSYTFGDGTVSSSSALMGPLKWIYENRKGEQSSYKPVKLVEMCSKYGIKDEPYDEIQEDGQKVYTKSGYQGLDCSCFYTEKLSNCEHSCMISEPFYLQFIANTLAGKEISAYLKGDLEMPYFDHYSLSDFIGQCPNLFPDDIDDDLTKNIEIQEGKNWLPKFHLKSKKNENLDQNLGHKNSVEQQIIELKMKTRFGNSYSGIIQLGTDKQELSAMFDTGSSTIWFTDSDCDTCAKAGIENFYTCSASKACRKSSYHKEIQYGKGNIKGRQCQDQLTIGDKVIKNQDFLSVYSVNDFTQFPADGLIGLGSTQLNDGYPTMMDNLYSQNLIDNKIFAMVLSPSNSLSSFLDIGALDHNLYQGSITYLPVKEKSQYWAVHITELFMKNQKGEGFGIKKDGNITNWQLISQQLVIDSGTSIITFPYNDVQAILQILASFGHSCYFEKQKYQQIFCEMPAKGGASDFPVLGVMVKGYNGEEIEIDLDPSTYIVCDVFSLKGCIIRITILDLDDVAIFGDLFMQSFYTVFDITNSQIGFGYINEEYFTHAKQHGSVRNSKIIKDQQGAEQNVSYIQMKQYIQHDKNHE